MPTKHPGYVPPRVTFATASVFLVALCLRPAITSLGPLLPDIGLDLDLSEGMQGLLGSIPLIAFGLISPLVHRFSRRWGSERTILVALIVLAIATAMRSWTGSWGLWFGTLFIGAAIGVGNVLVPIVVRRDFAGRVATATGWYSACITGGAAVASAVAVPLATVTDWRFALGVWALLAVIVAAIWAPRARTGGPAEHPTETTAEPAQSVWRWSTAWWVTAYLGLQSTAFYILVNWLPTIEISHGVTAEAAGIHLFVFQGLGLFAGLAIPALLKRSKDERLGVVVGSLPVFIGVLGLLLAPSLAIVWVLFAGVGQGASLVAALSLVSLRGRTHAEATQLSGMAQSVGYLLAATGPVAMGAIAEATGDWTASLSVLAVITALMVLVGFRAGMRPAAS